MISYQSLLLSTIVLNDIYTYVMMYHVQLKISHDISLQVRGLYISTTNLSGQNLLTCQIMSEQCPNPIQYLYLNYRLINTQANIVQT